MSGSRGPLSEQREDVRQAKGMDPRRADTQTFDVEAPTCPSFIQGEAKREWTRVTKQLAERGRLTPTDRAALTRYVVAWADFRELSALLNDQAAKDGPLAKYLDAGSKGQLVQAALVKTRRDMAADLAAAEKDLRLPVSQRLRLPATPERKPESKLDELARRWRERRAKREPQHSD
jgi:P27 family predicted phage terminase small subunit